MKKIFLLILITSFSFSCKDFKETRKQQQEHLKSLDKSDDFIEGKHPLRKFRVFDQANGQSYSSFFLIGGSTSTSVDINRKIGFYWLSNEKQYIYTTVDMTDVRVVIDSTAHIPFIDFKWRDSDYKSMYVQVQDNIEYSLDYLVIHTKEEDFPQDINLGDLK